jgi:hypothetical protein
LIWGINGFVKLVGLTGGEKMLRTWINDEEFIDRPIPEPVRQIFQETIDVLELELDSSLDDKEWDDMIDKKLYLKLKLKKILDDKR